MGSKKSFVAWLAFLCVFVGAAALAEPEKPKFKDDPIRLDAKSGVAFEVKLRPLLVNPQIAVDLQWAMKNHPAWLQLDKVNERLHGTPSTTDAGVFDFRGITVMSDEGGDIDHRIVLSVFAPPKWKDQNIDLGIQNEDKAFNFDLKTVLTDPADPTFATTKIEATGLPGWMTLNGTILSGTPKRPDVGDYAGIVLKATGKGGVSTANAFGKVLKTIKPPKWIAKEITLNNAFENQAYNRNVVEFTLNPEQTQLRYEIVSVTPPPWLSIGTTSGTLFGTPKKANIGPVSVAVILRTTIDGQPFDDTTTFKFNVVDVNEPPQWLADPINLPPGLTKVKYTQDLSKSATDPDDGDVLTFRIVSFSGPGPAWAVIDPATGVLTGTPDKPNLGENTWLVSVTDKAGLSDTATVKMTVNKSNEPPFWKNDPTILADAKEDANYEVDLDNFTTDPDNDPLTYTKLDGPTWFSISPTGVLMGTPDADDLGLHTFRVKVDDKISGSDVADLKILVLHVNHKPEWILNPIILSAKEEQPVNQSIAQWAKDKDVGDTLSFSIIEGPAWAKLSATGLLTGTPPVEGKNEFRVIVADQHNATAETKLIVNVANVNKKPFWTQDPITLAKAKEGIFYNQSVASFAQDPDNDPLTFSLINGPSWVTVSSNGAISGTPGPQHVGINTMEVRVMDPSNEFDVATVRIEVEKVNKAPRCRQTPILMGDIPELATFNFDLTKFVVDDDGDELKYKLFSFTGPGANWMFVGEAGDVTGVPMHVNEGAFTAVFEITDGQLAVKCDGKGVVIHKNQPPVINQEIGFIMKERTIFTESLNQAKYVADPDGDPLNFVLESSSEFITLSSQGQILANKPQRKHVGVHIMRFKVDDGQVPVHGEFRIIVEKDPRAPIWIVDPINDVAKTNELYRGILSDKAKDLDGLKLNFMIVSGPGWLSVNSLGDMSGTPKDANIGMNEFTVRTCNTDNMCADAKLRINVEPGTKEDVHIVDTPVPTDNVENIWIVDNSSHCDKTIRELKKHIGVYFTELSSAPIPIKYAGIFLSADAHKWDGLPIKASGQQTLMKFTDANPAGEFNKRTDEAYSNGACGNCYNSPIWSLFRFLQRLPSLTEIYHNGFTMPEVPVEAMIVTNQRDHYPYFAKHTPQKPWKPEDYAKDFLDFHQREHKAFRANAIAPECPTLSETSGDETATAHENAYRIVVDKTGGKYYATGCNFDMAAFLRDYAKRVIFRAYVHGKHRIKLSQTPVTATGMEVTIGNVLIPADTGKWLYNSSTNEVIIHWHLIDFGQIKSGDTIRIKFRVS